MYVLIIHAVYKALLCRMVYFLTKFKASRKWRNFSLTHGFGANNRFTLLCSGSFFRLNIDTINFTRKERLSKQKLRYALLEELELVKQLS